MAKKNKGRRRASRAAMSKADFASATRRVFKTLEPKEAVDFIRKGLFPSSEIFRHDTGARGVDHREGMIKEGLVSALLDRLNQCEEETFDLGGTIVAVGRKKEPFSPGHWLSTLGNTMRPGFLATEEATEKVRLEIVAGIGPVINCMCDDVQREFFQSNKHWVGSMVKFLDLLCPLAKSRDAVELLMQNSGLRELVVQSLFWRKQREDIVREFAREKASLDDVEGKAREVLDWVVHYLDEGVKDTGVAFFQGKGQQIVNALALTPIVNQACNSQCNLQFVTGLLDVIKSPEFRWKSSHDKSWYFDHVDAAAVAGIVDSHVIGEVVGLGNSAFDREMAAHAVKVIFNMLCPRVGADSYAEGMGHHVKEDDTRFAIAINRCLVETCLGMLRRFGGDESKGEKNAFFPKLDNLVDSIKTISFSKKSAKALASQSGSIAEALKLAKAATVEYEACRTSLRMIEAMMSNVDESGASIEEQASCERCNKMLGKDQIYRCGKCKRSVYCSRQCQVADWNDGEHKFMCKTFARHAERAAMGGGGKKQLQREEAQFANAQKVGKMFVHEKTHHILFDAVLNGNNILDCYVSTDLNSFPHSWELRKLDSFLENEEAMKDPHFARNTMKLLESHRAKGRLVCTFRSGVMFVTSHLDPFMAPGGSWAAAQANVEGICTKVFGSLEKMRKACENPDILEHFSETVWTALTTTLQECRAGAVQSEEA